MTGTPISAASSDSASIEIPRAAPAIAIVLLTIAAYIPALSAGYIWDDDSYLTANPVITAPDGIWQSWSRVNANPQYYPLVFTSFWLEHHAWGVKAFGYHLDNVLLHAANSVLVLLILRRLRVPGSWFAAAVFAIHPVNVESVAWITERKNVLSTFFYLLALSSYLRFELLDEPSPRRRWGWYAAAMALFPLALFSKTVTCSLPAAVLLLLWWKRDRLRIRDIAPLLPMFALGLGMAFITSWVEHNHVGAKELQLGLTPVSRCVLAGQAVWFYLTKLLWPTPLIFIYPKWTVDPAKWVQWTPSIGLLAVLIGLFAARRRIGRGPLVAALLYGGTLVPALGFIDVFPMRYSWVADHFQYLAAIAPIAAVSGIIATRMRRPTARTSQSPEMAWLQTGVGAAVVGCLMFLTYRQCFVYRDAATVWRVTLAKNPSAWMARNNLANLLIKQGKASEARPYLTEALERDPRDAMAYRLLAHADLASGLPVSGERNANRALELGADDAAEAHSLRGLARGALGRPADALADYDAALAINPRHVNALMNKAYLLMNLGRPAEACQPLQAALEKSPDFVDARLMLAQALLATGRADDAVRECRETLRRRPNDQRGQALLQSALEARSATPAH